MADSGPCPARDRHAAALVELEPCWQPVAYTAESAGGAGSAREVGARDKSKEHFLQQAVHLQPPSPPAY